MRRFRLAGEILESRKMLAVYTVNTLQNIPNDQSLSLEEAVYSANRRIGETHLIKFDESLGDSIELIHPIDIKTNVVIDGHMGRDSPITLTGPNLADCYEQVRISVEDDSIPDLDFQVFLATNYDTSVFPNGSGGVHDGFCNNSRAFVVHDHMLRQDDHEGPIPTVTLRGMTIRNFHTGRAVQPDFYQIPNGANMEHGAAISNWGDLTLDNVEFVHNTTEFSGGAVYSAGTLNVINGTEFRDNTARFWGGGIYGHDTLTVEGDAVLNVSDSVFDSNVALSWGVRGAGGAIYVLNDIGDFENQDTTVNLTVRSSEFVGNRAPRWGGGAISAGFASIDVETSEFVGNEAADELIRFDDNHRNQPPPNTLEAAFRIRASGGNSGRGGAIYVYDANIGRANLSPGAATTIDSSTFESNVGYEGAAVYSYIDQNLIVKNSTFTENAADRFGVLTISNVLETAQLDNLTIVDNSVDNTRNDDGRGHIADQGAIHSMRGGATVNLGGVVVPVNQNVILRNSAIIGSRTTSRHDPTCEVSGMISAESEGNFFESPGLIRVCEEVGTAGNAYASVVGSGDAMLGNLAHNGGPTRTHLPMDGSPLIDAASLPSLDVDQRGQRRIGAPDIGSVERIAIKSSDLVPISFVTGTPRTTDLIDRVFREDDEQ